MCRRHVVHGLLAGMVLAGVFAACGISQADEPRRPNVVVFVVDDLGYMDIGANNRETFYETPHVDRLAATGMRFTSGYSTCPVCSPTRASLMTGKYPQRVGITDYIGAPQPDGWKRPTKLLPAPYATNLALEETTLAETFSAAGYATCFAGKWHLGSEGFWPEDQGFDLNFGGIERGGPYGGSKYFSPYGNPRLTDGPPGEHLPDRLATEVARFIGEHREQPFFAYFSFYDVHTPLMARPDLQAKYERKAAGLPPREPRFGREGERDVRLVQDHAVYAGMVEAMDLAVGKVLAALEEHGAAENTIVVFTSDNGGLSTSEGSPTSNVPLRAGKGWMYEGGIRVPWIIRAPGVTAPGSLCHEPMNSCDLFATLCGLTGVAVPEGAAGDSTDLTPLLRGEELRHGPIYWHYPHYGNQGTVPAAGVRDGDWKLIEWYEDGRRELYRLGDDLSETRDLAAEEPERVARLAQMLEAWRQDVGAKMPTERE